MSSIARFCLFHKRMFCVSLHLFFLWHTICIRALENPADKLQIPDTDQPILSKILSGVQISFPHDRKYKWTIHTILIIVLTCDRIIEGSSCAVCSWYAFKQNKYCVIYTALRFGMLVLYCLCEYIWTTLTKSVKLLLLFELLLFMPVIIITQEILLLSDCWFFYSADEHLLLRFVFIFQFASP